MPNLKTQKLKNFLGHVLEPIALGVLALLFIIPAITVQNLTPITKKLKELNVLGVTTQNGISVDLVGGKHEAFTSENLSKADEDNYTYTTILNKGIADSYSKPILEIKNGSSEVKNISFYGQTDISTKSNINIIVNNTAYKIEDDQGQTYPQTIQIASGQDIFVFLASENLNNVQFSENFEMQIKVESNL